MPVERTLVVLKPDAIAGGFADKIIARFKGVSLAVIARKDLSMATEEELDAHLPKDTQWVTDLGDRACRRLEIKEGCKEAPLRRFGSNDFFKVGTLIRDACVRYYLSGPITVLVLEGDEAVARVRKLIGNALPSQAAKGTIRGDFGTPEDSKSVTATRNLIHASDSAEEAGREMLAWFTEDEIKKFSS